MPSHAASAHSVGGGEPIGCGWGPAGVMARRDSAGGRSDAPLQPVCRLHHLEGTATRTAVVHNAIAPCPRMCVHPTHNVGPTTHSLRGSCPHCPQWTSNVANRRLRKALVRRLTGVPVPRLSHGSRVSRRHHLLTRGLLVFHSTPPCRTTVTGSSSVTEAGGAAVHHVRALPTLPLPLSARGIEEGVA